MVVLLCCYSYSSLAYDQQYTVGDTGPNGGTVTSVDVTSAITGTEVTLNGGFEDTTTTTQFVETVIEQISTSQTTTQTTTQLVSTTTSNSNSKSNSEKRTLTPTCLVVHPLVCRNQPATCSTV